MQPKHMLAHAVAISLVIALVIYLSTSLGGNILDVPAKYRAEYSVKWIDGKASYKGQVSVESNSGAQSYKYEHRNGSNFKVVEISFSRGFLFGQAFGAFATPERCYGRFVPLGVASTKVSNIANTFKKLDDGFSYPGQECADSLYAFSAFETNYILCVESKLPKWVAGPEFVLTVDKIFPDEYVEFTPSAASNNSYCMQNGTWIGSDNIGASRRLNEDSSLSPPMPKKLRTKSANFGAPMKYEVAEPKVVEPESRQLARQLNTGNTRVCFIHGMGNKCGADCSGTNSDPDGQGEGYWGSPDIGIEGAQNFYLNVNTRDRGYNNVELQNDVKNFVKEHQCTHVFGHSMGGPTLASADIKFYATQTPFRGSWAASLTGEFCGGWGAGKILAWAMGYCDGNQGCAAIQSLSVKGQTCRSSGCHHFPGCGSDSMGSHAASSQWCSDSETGCKWYKAWNCGKRKKSCCNSGRIDPAGNGNEFTENKIKNDLVLGSLCGTDSLGTGGWKGLGLSAISLIVGFGEKDDGMVALSSCQVPGKSYSGNPSSKWYKGDMNHLDGTAHNGDGSTNSKKPLTWMQNMVKNNPVTKASDCPIPNECTPDGTSSCNKNSYHYERAGHCAAWAAAGFCITYSWLPLSHYCPCSCS